MASLKMHLNPNTQVLTVESERTTKFLGKIGFGSWYAVKDLEGKRLFDIQIEQDGKDYIFNVEGIDETDPERPEDYDISDLINCQSYKVSAFSKKYVFVEVKIRNGEYEYYSKSLHIIGKKADIRKCGEKHARHFYANFSHEEDGTYYFNGGEVATELYKSQEITVEEYQVLRKFTN